MYKLKYLFQTVPGMKGALITTNWPHEGSSQSVSYLRHCTRTMNLTGTDRQTDGQDQVLSQANALTKKRYCYILTSLTQLQCNIYTTCS